MSVKSFKFVSPGIFINEVDNSQLPRLPEELGPVIIGRAERGPAMVPVKIDSFSDFVETFGNPIAGGEGDDVWRQGNRLGPTYAAFAAQAYLKSASPITFVRLLGEQSPDAAGDDSAAGFEADHAYGLFVRKNSAGAAKHLAAVIYSDSADLGLWNGSAKINTELTLDAEAKGKIPFAGVTGTSAVASTINLTFDTPVVTANANAIATFQATLPDPGSQVALTLKNSTGGQVEVSFDSTAVSNTYTPPFGGPGTLTVGTSGLGTTADIAAEFVNAFTEIPAFASFIEMTAAVVPAANPEQIKFTATTDYSYGALGSFIVDGGYLSVGSFVDAVATQSFELKAIDGEGASEDITVILDTSTTSVGFVAPELTVGLSGKATVALQAEALAEAINNHAPATTTVTASANAGVVSLAQDIAGVLAAEADFVDTFVPALDTFLSTSAFVAGTASATTAVVTTFSFDENSKLYIRNVLNTNPTLTNEIITSDAAQKNYWLGSTFDLNLERVGLGKASDIDRAQLINLADIGDITGNPVFKNLRVEASSPSTPQVVSQYLGLPSAFDPAAPAVENLFKIHALYAGEWEQANFKISISDVAAPKNSFTKYGTFSVIVRDAKDTDAAPIVYERFSNCDLDPTSSNYIGVKIGDMKQFWSDSELRYVEEGQYLNQSRFIRVEVTPEVEQGALNPELLPFGFEVPKTVSTTGEYNFPQLSLREDSKGTKISSPSQAFFGITTEDSDERYAPSYADAVRKLVKVESEDTLPERTKFFSLDLLKAEGANDAKYDEASMAAPDEADQSFNAVSGDYSTVLDEGFDKFTMPLTGGFNGLDITEIEPFNDNFTDSATAETNYAFYSMKKAIDMVSDPEVVECNLMAIPGVANPGITSHLISTCELRADALAVIDIENDYTPRGWDKTSEASRLPQVNQAVSTLRDRRINSSYGCAYFPWVQVRDSLSDKLVWMPPSVAALGTMASSAAKSELWFAPAGFTRGGLSTGAAGLPVIQTRYRLTSKQRDSLYEANINPIAQFPAEGIVIFGQKTLQVTPSALDRINVRRLMVYVKKEISRMAATLLFDQNVDSTWNRFLSKAEPFLASVKSRFGLTEYRVILDDTTTTPELVDRNIMYAKVFLKPARAIEFIAIDFVITNTGASFDD